MLRGKAKTDYVRNYMKKRRLKAKLLDPSVRPPSLAIAWKEAHPDLDWYGHPKPDADGNPMPEYT